VSSIANVSDDSTCKGAQMGNLGLYQVMATVAKKVGGPMVLVVGTAVSGWAIGRGAEAGGKGILKRMKVSREKKAEDARKPATTFTVTTEADCGGGLKLHVGDRFRVLSRDDDAVLIEVLDDAENPYFVSAEILMTVSDYPISDLAS
jgi:hypothetical protein